MPPMPKGRLTSQQLRVPATCAMVMVVAIATARADTISSWDFFGRFRSRRALSRPEPAHAVPAILSLSELSLPPPVTRSGALVPVCVVL